MVLKEYSLSQEDREEADRILNELRTFCVQRRCPMYATIAVANHENETEYDSIVYGAKSNDVELTDDRIRRHIMIADGFEAVPPREVVVFDPMGVMEEEDDSAEMTKEDDGEEVEGNG